MAKSNVFTKRITKQQRVRDLLMEHITSTDKLPEERLAPIPRLASLFDASVRTVQQAVKELEENGYVLVRPGSGTFIVSRHRPLTIADAVVLCMHGRGHVWSDMTSLFMDTLSTHDKLVMLWDPESNQDSDNLAKRLAHAEARTLIVTPFDKFPYHIFNLHGFQNKTVIAVLEWEGDVWPGLYRVLSDGIAGGNMIADHLWARGHRNILVVGTREELKELTAKPVKDSVHGPSLIKNWTERGGVWQALHSIVAEPVATFDEQAFCKIFSDQSSAPTAIIGLRDMEAWSAQWLLDKFYPGLLERIEIIGYFDTPWSFAGRPPFSTVSLNLEEIVKTCTDIMDSLAEGQIPGSDLIKVAPKLVLR